jgi:MFS transporter, SP family, solute carrier family 2 (myo-inositol transporter), member 13
MLIPENSNETKGGMSCALITLVFFATIGGFLFGYDTGVVSGVTIFWDDDPNLSLSSVQMEQLVSVTVGAAAMGTALSGMPLQWYGRRPLIMVASVFYLVAAVILLFANGKMKRNSFD